MRFLLLSAALGCGSPASPPNLGLDATTDANDRQDSPGLSDSSGIDAGPDGGQWHILLDAGGTCAPDAGPLAFKTCCNGIPCQGLCVQNDRGDIACSCGGIMGGCTSAGQVCCTFWDSCVDYNVCNTSQ